MSGVTSGLLSSVPGHPFQADPGGSEVWVKGRVMQENTGWRRGAAGPRELGLCAGGGKAAGKADQVVIVQFWDGGSTPAIY